MANIRESDIFIIQRIYTSGQEEIFRATGADLVQLAKEVYTSDSGSLTVRVTTLEGEVVDLSNLITLNEESINENKDEIILLHENTVQLKQELDAVNTRINSLESNISLKSKYSYQILNPNTLNTGSFTSDNANLLAMTKFKFSTVDLNGLNYSYHLIQIGQTIEMRWDDDTGATLTYGLFEITKNDSTVTSGEFTVRLLAGSGLQLDSTTVAQFRIFPVMEPGSYLTGSELESALDPIRDDITKLNSDVVKTVNGTNGISVQRSGNTATVSNTGIRDIRAGDGISINKSNYVATVNVTTAPFEPGDKVTGNDSSSTKSGGFYVNNGNLYYKA